MKVKQGGYFIRYQQQQKKKLINLTKDIQDSDAENYEVVFKDMKDKYSNFTFIYKTQKYNNIILSKLIYKSNTTVITMFQGTGQDNSKIYTD